MSNATGGNGVTAPQSPTGFELLQVSDFYQRAGILHPLAVGTIALTLLFLYLRLSSNRVVAPVTLFDWIINVALGSTLAGIVNGTSLARGLIAVATLLLFQLISSQISSQYGLILERAINAPPLVIAFRGHALKKVMRHHRISQSDLNAALRKKSIWNIREIEVVIIEPTGDFSIYKQCDMPDQDEECNRAEVLLDIPGYKRLVDEFDNNHKRGQGAHGQRGKEGSKTCTGDVHAEEDTANDIAAEAA